MLKTFQIDFIRAIVDWKLSQNDSDDYFTSDDFANFSFYEHLVSQEQVQRYVERYNELVAKQNRESYAGMGVFAISDNPTITNLYDTFISPFEFTYRVRCTLANRDKMLGTLYHLIDELKGRAVDIAELSSGELVPVGRITDTLHSGDFVNISFSSNAQFAASITSAYSSVTIPTWEDGDYLYCFRPTIVNGNTELHLIKVLYESSAWSVDEDYGTYTKYKVSLGFNDITVNEPFTLNASEYVTFYLGGSATLVSNGVRFGNDLVRVYIKKDNIITGDNSTYTFASGYTELEPLEMPSNANASYVTNQLRSNFFLPNTHTDSVAHTIQYTFVCDTTISLLNSLFYYGRYHHCNLDSNGNIQESSITPNIIYSIKEEWSSWGVVNIIEYKAKLVEDIDIENTEADITTLGLSFQLQGENY